MQINANIYHDVVVCRQYFSFVALTLCSELTVGVFSYLHQQRTDAALAHVLGRKLAKYYGVPDRGRETMAIDFVQYKVCTYVLTYMHEDRRTSYTRSFFV